MLKRSSTAYKLGLWYLPRQLGVWLLALAAAGALYARPAATHANQPDNPPALVSIRIADPAAAEAGQDPATLTVVRSGSAAAPLEVFYTAIGTATPGEDCIALPGSITIPAGDSSAAISIEPIDDPSKEGAEPVIVSLSIAPEYAIAAPTSATVRIADDDLPEQVLSFYVGDSNAAEPGADTGVFTIARDGSTAAPLTVFYTIGGTAVPGADYVALPNSVAIPAGEASLVVKVTPIDDGIVEATEIVVLSFSPSSSYSISAPASATVAIVDNDNLPSGAPQIRIFLPALQRGK